MTGAVRLCMIQKRVIIDELITMSNQKAVEAAFYALRVQSGSERIPYQKPSE